MEPTEWYEQATEENRREKFLFLYRNMQEIYERTKKVLAGYGAIGVEEINEIAGKGLGRRE
jgi:hypothetical protein